MNTIDLHVHSSFSDGTFSPSELVALAARSGLRAFALTDHDNTDGLKEAQKAAASYSVEVISGIEFSTEYLGKDIHIVGLDFHEQSPQFCRQLSFFRSERLQRNQKMIQKMAADGIDISYPKMVQCFDETVWTRAHFARYLMQHGYVNEMREAFKTFIGDDCKYFIPREKVSPFEVTRLIRSCHGIPVLAHPLLYHFSEDQLTTLLKQLKDSGLLGMEVYYSTHTEADTSFLLSLCHQLSLLPSGGSDFHGGNKPDISLGTGKLNLSIPYSILTDLRSLRDKGGL